MRRTNAAYRAFRMGRVVGPGMLRYRLLELRGSDEAAWARAHERFAKGLAGLGDDLGCLFVKLCQVAGARADVFPATFVRELSRFHDRVAPRPWSELSKYVEAELGTPLATVFSCVDPEPLAAASLAQVHRGWLHGGEPVALKIQYPEAERLYHTDLALVRRAVALASHVFRSLALRGPVEEVAHFIGLELDFAREAESMERIREALGSDGDVVVPRLHRALCTGRLLVMEFLDGTPIHDTARLAADGVDLGRLADRVAELYRRMLFEQGFFHGDPHPGNLLVLRDGRIGLLDFGLAKQLPPGFAGSAARMFAYTLGGDRVGALEAARGLGFRFDRVEPEAFGRLLQIALGARHDLAELQRTVGESGIEGIPSDVALVFRTLVLLNGLSERLAPGEQRIPRALFADLATRMNDSATMPAHAASVSPTRLPSPEIVGG